MNKKIVAGIDDATKCPCIGSIFMAGATADEDTIGKWTASGVKDSKCVAPKKREELAKIIKNTAISFVIREITPSMIDDKSLFNLNEWEMFMMLKIVQQLKKKADVAQVFIDNWEVSESRFFERLDRFLDRQRFRITVQDIEFIPEHQADETHTIVGAASILAKTASDRQYRRYRKQYGDFGSGSPGDPATRFFVWKHRKNPLPIIRISWRTYKHLAKLESIEEDFIVSRRGKNIIALLRKAAQQRKYDNGNKRQTEGI